MSTPNKVVVCRDIGAEAMGFLRAQPDLELVVWAEDRACDRAWLDANIGGAVGVVVTFSDLVTPELLDLAGPKLKAVSTMSVGYEHVNTHELSTRGIRLGYTPDVLTDAVADLTVMLALMAGRNAAQSMQVVSNGEWPTVGWSPFGFCGPQLSAAPARSRTAGFIGFGRISQAVLARLIPFGVTRCLYTANPASAPHHARDDALKAAHGLAEVRAVELGVLAAESDMVFVLAPGGPGTRHTVDAAFLRKMRRTAILVNASRGTVVDSEALATALKEGWIWGAGLDVVEGEPNVGGDHPLVREPRCVILPHIGSATLETRNEMAMMAATNVVAGIRGAEMTAELKF
ncbi:D-isomer specific 2-hydroxyacid dehydrogenase [Athelia psychrophila]|uniref:D-isomer specific 2-hydroxyacid dehydrogenase n=1 Tax=Athelia psychrophila TaxID=1759441 RepID=A0A166RJP5_9AGAM|nr:D-isomer specific 2-hydroxyacid dehydrogenase [Fibularhizoctonia sp. CBS 109695]